MSIYSKIKNTIYILFIVAVCIFFLKSYIASYIFGRQYLVNDPSKLKLLIVWAQGLGEKELLARYKYAAENLGIEYKSVSSTLRNNFIEKYADDMPQAAISAMKPDIVITLQDYIKINPGVSTYVVLHTNHEEYVEKDDNDDWQFKRERVTKFDGYLMPFPKIEIIAEACANINKEFYGLNWFPTVHKVDYKPATPKQLFYNGGSGALRNSPKYIQIFKTLAEREYFYLQNDSEYIKSLNMDHRDIKRHFIKERAWKNDVRATNQMIPFDGVSLLNKHNDTGVALLLHGEMHLPYGSPTGRIFEAAAANSIIISDENAFIKEHFGDNIFYIDVEQEPDEIVAQIDQHMQWIFDNPEAAKKKAQKCHEIFLSKFTLEDQILRLIALHKSRSNID